jgi:multidrug resistance efflux pump
MSQENRIPLSRAVRLRRLRYQTVPLIAFMLAVAASGMLWQNSGGISQGVGAVDTPHVDVTSPTAGLVISLPHQSRGQWLIYDHIQAGEVIARIEDQQLERTKDELQQEVIKLLDNVTLQADAAQDIPDATINEAVKGVWQFEKTRLLALEEQLTPDPQATLDDMRTASPPAVPSAAAESIRDAVARIREERRGLELRSSEVRRSAKALELQAPISGTLVALHRWPGQTVAPGARIATIAADYGRHIVSYIPEGSPLVARPGTPVTLRPRASGARAITSVVEQVGRRVEKIPSHQIASSKTQMWGTPVRIKMPQDALLQPGALVDVVYSGTATR